MADDGEEELNYTMQNVPASVTGAGDSAMESVSSAVSVGELAVSSKSVWLVLLEKIEFVADAVDTLSEVCKTQHVSI